MGLQSKIEELAAQFAADLVTAFRSATIEDIRSIAGVGMQAAEADVVPKPKRPPRRKRSWRRIKRFRIRK